MKRGKIITFALSALLLTACGKEVETTYYTTTYKVTKIEATVTYTTETGDNTLTATIQDSVIKQAPVQVGGGYTLLFSRADGGRLEVQSTTDGKVMKGMFVKTPGGTSIQMLYNDTDYACTLSSYKDNGTSKTLFTVDLTDAYKVLYPNANLKQVTRLEYTSHAY